MEEGLDKRAALALENNEAILLGVIITREGRFFRYFIGQLSNDISPEIVKQAFVDAGTHMGVNLRLFDERSKI